MGLMVVAVAVAMLVAEEVEVGLKVVVVAEEVEVGLMVVVVASWGPGGRSPCSRNRRRRLQTRRRDRRRCSCRRPRRGSC